MSGMIAAVAAGVLFLAYANGANDNFKGVATLYGSGLVTYRAALVWATAATLLGSFASIFLAQELIAVFTGKGLVPASLVGQPAFMLSVVAGAAVTVLATAVFGIPISTTHALTGALVGGGLAATGGEIGLSTLGHSFFLPLAISPLIPVVLLGVVYPATARAADWALPLMRANKAAAGPHISFAGDARSCHAARNESILAARRSGAIRAGALDAAHVLSAGAVSFARGLNDTPKIVAVGLAALAADIPLSITLVGAAMATGGLLHAWRIACTMSCRITPMSHAQGALANVVTSGVVIGASVMGMPVSTTHVSVGALFGLGAVTGRLRAGVAGGIVSAWLLTLPAAGALAGGIYLILETFA